MDGLAIRHTGTDSLGKRVVPNQSPFFFFLAVFFFAGLLAELDACFGLLFLPNTLSQLLAYCSLPAERIIGPDMTLLLP